MQPVPRSNRFLVAVAAILVPIAGAAATVRFDAAEAIPAAGPVSAVVEADINRDGRPDLVLIEPATSGFELVWLENGTTGWTRRLIATSASLAGMAVADLDRDGDLDVVASSPANNAIRWFANDGGDGTAWLPQTSITNTAGGITGIAVADIDGDGQQDIVGALTGVGEVRFWRLNGAGLWQERLIGAGASGIREVAVADIDSDGRIDVVGLVPGVAQIRWWKNPLNPGTAPSWTNQFVGNAGDPIGLAIADVDLDGAPDVLSASLDNGVIGLWINDGAGTGGAWTRNNLGSFAETASLVPTDLDRDGDLDVVLGRGGAAGEIAWLENLRDAGYALHTIEAPIEGAALVVLDDDLDGDSDLFAGATALQRLANRALGRGAAFSFTNDQVFLPLLANGARGAMVGHINDDARPDTVSTGLLPPEKSQAQVLLNFEEQSLGLSLLPEFDFSLWPGPVLPPRITDPAIADFDRDGRNELLFGSQDNGADLTTMGVCSNTAARFEDFPLWTCRELFADDGFGSAINASVASAPVPGDIDRDGLPDFVAGTEDWLPFGAGQRRLMWFEHLGDFALSSPFQAHEIALGVFSVVDVVDINGDGRDDVVTESALFRSDADDGSAWTRQDALPFGWQIFAAADLDRDAAVDLLAVTGLNQGLHWARRSGGIWQTFEIDADAQCPCSLGDMDLDGDVDVLALDANGAPLMMRNDLSRAPAAAWTPRPLFADGWALPVSGVTALDLTEDGTPELSIVSEGTQFLFTGLAAMLTAGWQAQPPAVLVEGEEAQVFEVELAHAGMPDDPEIALTSMHFDVLPQFNENSQPLDAAELELLSRTWPSIAMTATACSTPATRCWRRAAAAPSASTKSRSIWDRSAARPVSPAVISRPPCSSPSPPLPARPRSSPRPPICGQRD